MDLLDDLNAAFLNERVVSVKSNGMTQEIQGVILNPISLSQLLKGHLIDIHSFMSFFVILFEPLDELEKSLTSSLLKETHEIRLEGFAVISRDLFDISSSRRENSSIRPLVNVTSINRLPLEIIADLSLEHHFDQPSVGHDEFRNQVDVPVSIVT